MKNFLLGIPCILILLSLNACTPTVVRSPAQITADSAVKAMVFSQNARTGLCFGVTTEENEYNDGRHVTSVTKVDCTDVKNYL